MTSTPIMQLFIKTLVANFLAAQKKCDDVGVSLRPHIKTLHHPSIADQLKSLGLNKICVSNIDMLRLFLAAGYNDICLAIPCSPTWVPDINSMLNEFNVNLTLYVDHLDQLSAISELSSKVNVMIEIDAGQVRSGINWKHESRVRALIDYINESKHSFAGITAHFGQHYDCPTSSDVVNEMGFSMMRVLQLKEHLERDLDIEIELAIGDTPSFLASQYFDQVTEVRSGNFLLNDLTIHRKGLCELNQIGCAIKSTIISKFDDDLRIILHVGSVHLSKEKHMDDEISYGWVCQPIGDGLGQYVEGAKIIDLYQEHAVLVVPADTFNSFNIGDSLQVLPVHSCLAMDAMVHKSKFQLIE